MVILCKLISRTRNPVWRPELKSDSSGDNKEAKCVCANCEHKNCLNPKYIHDGYNIRKQKIIKLICEGKELALALVPQRNDDKEQHNDTHVERRHKKWAHDTADGTSSWVSAHEIRWTTTMKIVKWHENSSRARLHIVTAAKHHHTVILSGQKPSSHDWNSGKIKHVQNMNSNRQGERKSKSEREVGSRLLRLLLPFFRVYCLSRSEPC